MIIYEKETGNIVDRIPNGRGVTGLSPTLSLYFGDVAEDATKVPADVLAEVSRADKLAALAATDAGVIRGVDDLIQVLLDKEVIRTEDLPAQLKEKLDARSSLRASL